MWLVIKYKFEIYGVMLVGLIVKDKLFFMVLVECNVELCLFVIVLLIQIFGLIVVNFVNIQVIVKNVYNYDMGGFLSFVNNKDEKIVGKIDWNIMDGQKFGIIYINVYDQFEFQQNMLNINVVFYFVGFVLNGYCLIELLCVGIVQLNLDWIDNFLIEICGMYKMYICNQDLLQGCGFVQFGVCFDQVGVGLLIVCINGVLIVYFGLDILCQLNVFNIDIYGGLVFVNICEGDYNICIFVEGSWVSIYNLFL